MKTYKNIIFLLFIMLSTKSCGYVYYMGTKDRVERTDVEIQLYLQKINFTEYNYSLKMKENTLDLLAENKHVLDLYKLERNTEQSTMQIRVYDTNNQLITGYAQCYGDLNFLNILKTKHFVRIDRLPNNYSLKFKDELDLFDIYEFEKEEILHSSEGKNKIVIHWNIWSNHFSRIMLKKAKDYVNKFDPEMTNTLVIIANNDNIRGPLKLLD